MLAECLHSIVNMEVPTGSELLIIVVDNDREPTARTVVDALQTKIQAVYIHEQKAGIARARNAALRAAQRHGADWIAFIDDDEIADTNWLVGLMAAEYLDAPILMGWQIIRLPESRPFWAVEERNAPPVEGRTCKIAYTHNVRISIAVPNSGLAFNESLGHGGGEDVEFFASAYKSGFIIKQTARAITYETLHATRLTYRRQLHRAYWIASANFRRDFVRRGKLQTFLKRGHTIPVNFFAGVAILCGSPLAACLGSNSFKRTALLGGNKLARATGRAMAVLGHVPQPYQIIDGR